MRSKRFVVRRLFACVLVAAVAAIPVISIFGQADPRDRIKEKLDRARGIAPKNDPTNNASDASVPAFKPKPYTKNVEVQLVVTRAEFRTFDEARSSHIARIVDGEPVWIYAKIKGKLGDFAIPATEAGEDGKPRFVLYAEIAPQGDVSTINQYVIFFREEDLGATELKFNLAPGMSGRNRSMPLLLDYNATARPGVWRNEIRLTNTASIPRSLESNLAAVDVTFDLARGNDKYRAMSAEFFSLALRGTSDVTKLPIPGSFYSLELKEQALNLIRSKGIEPIRFYFAVDDWFETRTFRPTTKRTRKAFAVYTFPRSTGCFYGIAQIEQEFDRLKSQFLAPEITFSNDYPVACGAIE